MWLWPSSKDKDTGVGGGPEEQQPPPPALPEHDYIFCVSATAPARIIQCLQVPGSGQRDMLGHMDQAMKDSVDVAISWAHLNIRRVLQWVCPDVDEEELPNSLIGRRYDVSLALDDPDISKEGPSTGAGVCMALMAMVFRGYERVVRRGIAITGEVNLRGELLSISDLNLKLRGAYNAGCQKLIAPIVDVQALTDKNLIPEDLVAYAASALVPARHMLDVIYHSIEGKVLAYATDSRS